VSVEDKIDALHALVEKHVEEARDLRGRIEAALHGQPPDRPGLLIRVDRIEQLVGRWGRITWIAVTAAIGALAASVRAMVR
jgi:hypothetical protein